MVDFILTEEHKPASGKGRAAGRRNIDIEFTNRCNALCTFCPRDRMPKMGVMQPDVFERCIDRCLELDPWPIAKGCGTGEPLINPHAVDFVYYARKQGLDFNLTTNASLLTEDKARALFDAGLTQLNLSVSGVHDLYTQIYNLEFDDVLRNIRTAIRLAPPECRIMATVVECEDNEAHIEEIEAFWKNEGIRSVNVHRAQNRGGSLRHIRSESLHDRYEQEAWDLLAEHDMSHVCMVPFVWVIVGWDGRYYLCCHDWTKEYPVGSVFDMTVEEADAAKRELVYTREGCKSCSVDVINQLRAGLIETRDEGRDPAVLDEVVERLKPVQSAIRVVE